MNVFGAVQFLSATIFDYSAFYKLGYISSRSKGSIIEPLEADTMGARSPLDFRSVSARSRLDHGSVSARSPLDRAR